jgi:hypothetical protein
MSRRAGRLVSLLVIAWTAVFALRRLDNTDTWWHLAAGRWIVAHRSVPATDPLSWTVPDHVWVNVQWLFDVVIYALHQLGGPSLLVLASAAAYAGATALLLVNVERYVTPVVAAVLSAWATLVSQERFAIRPEMASYLLLQVMLWLYATGRTPGASRRLWVLPAVMCLWANCHSLFIVGAVVVACQMIGSLVTDLPFLPIGWRRPIDPAVRRDVLATGVAAFVATAINPFGLTGATFPLVLMSRINGDQPIFRSIGELRRPFENYFVTLSITAYQVLFIFAVTMVGLALVVAAFQGTSPVARPSSGTSRAQRRRTGAPPPPPRVEEPPRKPIVHVDLADVAVFAGVAYLSLLARRNMALFAMGGLPCLAASLALLATRLPEVARTALPTLERGLAVVLSAALVAGGWFVASNGFYRWNGELHECGLGMLDVMFPLRAAEFVRAQALPGPLFNDFTDGGYLTWAEAIPGGVYIDGRTEVYDVDFLGPYMTQVANPPAWQSEMDRRGIQTVVFFHWWPNHQVLLRYLTHDARWALVYYDETSVVLVRRAANDETIARATAAFAPARDATEKMLLDPGSSWQWAIGRMRGLIVYANLLGVLGRPADAARFNARLEAVSSGR